MEERIFSRPALYIALTSRGFITVGYKIKNNSATGQLFSFFPFLSFTVKNKLPLGKIYLYILEKITFRR